MILCCLGAMTFCLQVWVFWVLFLSVILAIGLSLALIINFIPSKAELASGDYVGARGLAWPWTVPQAIFVSAYIINLLLAYGFVQYYTGWTHDVQHYVHAVALSICLTLLIWLETFPAGYHTHTSHAHVLSCAPKCDVAHNPRGTEHSITEK